jgi:Holliday junction resolvasome RuvABC ATP-dependent DNA helicase subunit
MIDEVQQVTKSMEQCLLKALEPKDRMLVTEDGRKLDTSRLLFAFCTTDIGDLFDALVCRLMPVEIRLYSKVEMAQIIALNYPHWPGEACRKVAHYSSQNPRESLRFAKTMQDEIDMREDMGENADYLVVSDYVARESNIDPHGMTMQRLRVLTALGHQPVSAARLRHVCGVKDSELYKFILPPLLSTTPDQPAPLLTVSNKGYTITPAGLAELDKREIGNRGIEAIPKSVRSLFKIEPVSRKKTYGDLQPSDLE